MSIIMVWFELSVIQIISERILNAFQYVDLAKEQNLGLYLMKFSLQNLISKAKQKAFFEMTKPAV